MGGKEKERRVGGRRKGKGGERKGERMWRGPESGLPRGPCWLSAGLPATAWVNTQNLTVLGGYFLKHPVDLTDDNNNNNNNNNQDNVYGAVIMAEPLREFTRSVHLMNVEWRQAAADPRPSQTT